MSSDDLDDAIDEAVRGIMSVEPAAGLRARVMRGLAAPEPRRRFTWPRMALAAGMASCAAILMLLVLRGPDVADTQATPTAAPAVAGALAPLAPPPVRTAEAPPRGRGPVSVVHRPTRGLRTTPSDSRMVSAASLIDADAETVWIAPLAAVQPIAVEPLRTDVVHVPDIVIAPLRFEPVRVDPLPFSPR